MIYTEKIGVWVRFACPIQCREPITLSMRFCRQGMPHKIDITLPLGDKLTQFIEAPDDICHLLRQEKEFVLEGSKGIATIGYSPMVI